MIVQIVETIQELRANRVAGSLHYRSPDDGPPWGAAFICPCGCGSESWLPFRGGPSDHQHGPGWTWDGNIGHPTLSPSILQSGMPCKWHGYLRAGEWVLA